MSTSSPIIRNPERTRRRLLAAAIRLFVAHGYDGVSVNQIVSAARVNKRMVYHYFGSKDEIYHAVLNEVYHRIDETEFEAMETKGTPRQKLVRLMENGMLFLDTNPEYVRLLLWENLSQGKHIARREHHLSKSLLLRFEQIVAEGVALGEFRPDLDVKHLLIQFIGLNFIYHSNRYSLSQAMDMDLGSVAVRHKGMRHALQLVFEGIAFKGKPKPGKRAKRAAKS